MRSCMVFSHWKTKGKHLSSSSHQKTHPTTIFKKKGDPKGMAISFAAKMFPKHDEQLSKNVDVCSIWLNSWCLNSLMFHTVSDFQNVHDSISNCCEFTLSLSRNCQDFCHVADHRTIMKGIRICTRCNGGNPGDIYLEMIPNLLPEQSFQKTPKVWRKTYLTIHIGCQCGQLISGLWSSPRTYHIPNRLSSGPPRFFVKNVQPRSGVKDEQPLTGLCIWEVELRCSMPQNIRYAMHAMIYRLMLSSPFKGTKVYPIGSMYGILPPWKSTKCR